MELFYFSASNDLDSFISGFARSFGVEFLQSWDWGEVMKNEGQEVRRIGIKEGGRIVAAATLIKRPLFGRRFYWYLPRGPIGEKRAINFLLENIKDVAGRPIFCRFEPVDKNFLRDKRIKQSLSLQPAKTLFLNLGKSEESLLAAMHQKTRYNIRLAEKRGVEVREGGAQELGEFNRLLNLTGQRDGFRLHGSGHYEHLLKDSNNSIKLFLAYYKNQVIAAALVSFFGGRATYLHGASDNVNRQIMAPHLLQWEIIRYAKVAGYKYYDFYGIDEKRWPGVTRFKLGFGGEVFSYPGTFDLIYRPLVYQIYDKLRKVRRLYGGNK